MTETLRIAGVSVLVALVVLGLKLLAWGATGSVALLSDALESVVNVAAAGAALLAVRLAARPPDATHPYGHHKAELIAAAFEGLLILLAAGLILHEAWGALQAPRMIDAPWTGLAINLAAGGLNAIWCAVLLRRGRALRSPALEADGRHLLADVVSSVGVAAGVALAVLTGWTILDPLLAAAVAVNVVVSGWGLVRRSLSGLLDEAAPEETQATVRAAIAAAADGALEAHDLRTRHAGGATFVDFHLVVPGEVSVAQAHALCDRIETAIEAAVPGASVAIHVEPESEAAQGVEDVVAPDRPGPHP